MSTDIDWTYAQSKKNCIDLNFSYKRRAKNSACRLMRQQLHSVLSMAIIYTSHAPRVFSIDEFDWLKCQDEKNTDTHSLTHSNIEGILREVVRINHCFDYAVQVFANSKLIQWTSFWRACKLIRVAVEFWLPKKQVQKSYRIRRKSKSEK